MTQKIHIVVERQEDRDLILTLAKRLGLKWDISPNSAATDTNRKALQQIINSGVEAPSNRMNELLSRNVADREDRDLPFSSQ